MQTLWRCPGSSTLGCGGRIVTLIGIQRRIMEAGRIRIGQQVPTSNGKTRPAKLDTFRLTSADRVRIDQAATLFGGTVGEWTAPSGRQWEVVTEATALDVIVPPSDMAFSQHFEIWSAGGCQRRCDGQWEQVGDQACVCDPEARDCDLHTRLSLLIRDLPGLGVWRIDSQGWYAAIELGGAVQVIAAAAGRGVLLPARLMLQQRSVIRRGLDGKPQTRRFAVPVLDVEITPRELLGGMAGTTSIEVTQLESLPSIPGRPALLQAVPDSVPERPVRSIAEQAVIAAEAKKPRANAAQPIPSTGLEPRTAAEAGTVTPPADPEHEEAFSDEEKLWITLDDLVAHNEPSKSDTVPVIEGRLRDLYRLMSEVGLWPIKGSPDPLHQALKKYAQADHVGELNKAPLLEFCGRSWAAARDAVAKAG